MMRDRCSGDKDLMQFVDGPVKMLDTMKDRVYEREDVKDKMGVYPEQIVDYLSLIGDSSDNIPGVPGIGPKGAQGLLEEFGTLDKVLENIPEQVLQDILEYLKQLQKQSADKINLSSHLRQILQEDKALLEKLAK
jgi:5'-3' exonuclease